MNDGFALDDNIIIFTVDTTKHVPVILPTEVAAFIFGESRLDAIYDKIADYCNQHEVEFSEFLDQLKGRSKPKKRTRKPKQPPSE